MKKHWLAAVITGCITTSALSQTLLTYGKYQVDASVFLRAFDKSNQQPADRPRAIREYLDLYINSRLKIQEAYDRGYDTLMQARNELNNLRNQVIDNYMSDPQVIDRLAREAFRRSLKDIHTAHIFIADNAADDTAASRKKLDAVLGRLQKGEDFLSVAQQFSDDPAAKENKGDLHYITVFTLPYELENIIYATAPGSYSAPYRSKAGYHIFKNLGERKALGKIRIQQILIALPPGVDETGKKQAAWLADSLYRRIRAGDDFGKLAAAFSNDYISAASNGNVPAIEVGRYDPVFEKAIWSLPRNGAVSKPFLTSHGYHIVKRIALTPVIIDSSDNTSLEELKRSVAADDRWKSAKDFIYTHVREKGVFRELSYDKAALWALSDSLLEQKPAGAGAAMDAQSGLFKAGDRTITVSDWIGYARMNRNKPGKSGIIPYDELMDGFIKSTMYSYYRDHLEDFNEDFRNQMTEFREGILFFGIMQQEVWDKAQADSVALLALYEKNKARYDWKPGADAVIFFCADMGTAQSAAAQVKKNPAAWEKIVAASNDRISIDSGRYEWSQVPGAGKAVFLPGTVTSPVINPLDNTASFAWIIGVHDQSSPRSFDEATGLVMNDYQNLLEQEWIKELKRKYPVIIDERVLAQISK